MARASSSATAARMWDGQAVGRGNVGGDELDLVFHQAREEGDVAREAAELCDDEGGLVLLARVDRGAELGPARESLDALPRLHFDKLLEELPAAAVQILVDGRTLGLEPQAAFALLVGRDAQVTDEFALGHARSVCVYTAWDFAGICCREK